MLLASRRTILLLSRVSARIVGRLSFTIAADTGRKRSEELSSVSLVGESVELLVGDLLMDSACS